MFNSGYRNRRASDGTGIVNSQLNYIQTRTPNPAITGWTISGSDDTALNPAGGQTVLVNGSGFASGISATLNGIQIGAVTLVSPTQISFTAPANSGGSYTLVVYNANGGAAILVPGLTYSSIPTYSTAAGSIGSYYETTAVSTSVTATSDSALTYTLASGSLPSGATLFGNGVITGTSPVESGSTTYTFAITATDAELQDVTRTFTLTINTDVVTWSSPDDGTTYTNSVDTAISNVSLSASSAAGYTVSYAANTLPTGVTLSNNTISGTPTVVQSVTTQLTATAATTNRSATRTINWVITILGDVYFKNTTMLLSANNSVTTSSFITDNSLNNALITPVGDSRAQNFNPYQFGYYSYQFNGSTDYLSTSRTGGWLTSGGNFTLEFWGYLTAYSALYVSAYFSCPFGTSGASNGWEHGFTGTATSYTGYSFNFKGGTPLTASYNFSLNVWYHIAVVKNGSTTAIYINGVSSATTTSFSTWTDNAALNIGQLGVSSYNFWFPGYLSNIRIVNGVAMYTGNFTPSTTPLVAVPGTILLTAQSNRFSDNSPNNYTLTVNSAPKTNTATPFTTVYQAGTQYYSVYFDGTGDYLSTTLTAQAPGTGNFTYECWFYTSSLSSSRSIMNTRSGDTTDGFDLSITTNGAIGATYTNTGLFTSSLGVVVINTWYHIAVVRTAGTTITVYLNGTSLGNFTAGGSTNFTSTTLYIGAGALAGVPMLGYISNFRYTKGQALYTSNFTPSTSPLTTTSQGATAGNVIILTCQSPTITDNSSNAFAVTANGDTRPLPQSPFVPMYYSNYFDGSSKLSIANNSVFDFGTGDFTVEFWMNVPSWTGGGGAIIGKKSGDGANGWQIYRDGNQTSKMDARLGQQNNFFTTSTPTNGVWQHWALVRSGTNVYWFLNGVLDASTTSSVNITDTASLNIAYADTWAVYGTVSLSNIRIVKGQALYTSAFTPSTTPLTTTSQGATASNVSLLTCQSLYFIDNSTNVFAITATGTPKIAGVAPFTQPTGYSATAVTTYGSGYFDGTGDYLTAPAQAALSFSTGDFTIECWAFYTAINADQGIIDCRSSGGILQSWVLNVKTGGVVDFIYSGSARLQTAGLFSINTWNHIAVTRASGTIRIFVNGVQGASVSYASAIDSNATNPNIGRAIDPAYTTGYISDLRVIKGTALYTSAFVPQFTAPLTAVTNTQLLTLQTRGAHNNSTFADGSGFNTLITRAGNVSNGTFSPYGNNFSNYFGTTSDYLSVPIASFPYSGTTWTIEGWFNLGTVSGTVGFFCSPDLLECKYSGTTFSVIYRNNPASATWTTVSGTITMATGTWYHIAISVSAGSMRLFINGVQYGSTTSVAAGAWGGTSPNAVWIGVNDVYTFGSVDQTLNGYVSNFRITNTAVYTSSFTPATTPLTAITGTSLLTCQGNRFIDTSLVNNTITKNGSVSVQKFSPFGTVTVPTYYSNYFDGSGDYLSITGGTTSTIPSGNNSYTMEAWVYATALGTSSGIMGWGAYSTTNAVNALKLTNSNTISNYWWGNDLTSPAVTGLLNAWNHIAATFDGTTRRLFYNGTLVASDTPTGHNVTTVNNVTVGFTNGVTASEYFTGYISNARVVKGQALYTSDFTPSTAPLTTTSQGATASNVSILTSQSSTLIDNSTNYFAITANGDVKPLAVSPFTPTASSGVPYTKATFSGSMYFDGTGDYLTLPTTFSLTTTGNFTAEAWVYPTSTADGTVFYLLGNSNSYAGLRVGVYNSTAYILHSTDGGSWAVNSSTVGTVNINSWNHIAVTRNANAGTLRVNGISVYTFTFGTLYAGTTNFIGALDNSGISIFLSGYLSDARVTNGAALYTSSFFPGPAPLTSAATVGATNYSSILLLNGTAGGVIDASRTVNLETVADTKPVQFSPYSGSYYSNYFDGAGDYLTTTLTGQTLGSGDFTIEFWMFQQINETHIFTYGTAWGDTTGVQMIYYSGSTNYCVTVGNANNNYFGNILRDQWVHVAIVRSSGTVKVYFNGVASATTLSTTTNLTATALNIGYAGTGNWSSYAGYISNFRMVAGTAVYTTNFTPPTAPITAISGTRLLTCQSNMLVDNSANAFTITRTGDVAVKTQNPFAVNSGTSYYFDGTGDYLTLPENTGLWHFGSGDFTIECWIYLGATNASTGYIIARSQHGVGSDWYVGLTSTNQLQFYALTGGAGNIATSTGTLVLNTWTHVAVTRSGTNVRLFINGIVDGTLSAYAGVLTASYGPTVISNASNNTGSHYITGYITDLRVTKGYARYTATFTPSTTPLFLK